MSIAGNPTESGIAVAATLSPSPVTTSSASISDKSSSRNNCNDEGESADQAFGMKLPSQQPSPPVLTLLPRSNVLSSAQSSPLASASSSSPTFKIMRRDQSTASISRNVSQSSSLAFDSSTGSTVTTPDENDPSGNGASALALRKHRKDMTIEEREAAYRAARERIFNNGGEGPTVSTTPPATATMYEDGAEAVHPPHSVAPEAIVSPDANAQPDKSRSRDRRRDRPREKGQAWERRDDGAFDPYAKGKGRFVASSVSPLAYSPGVEGDGRNQVPHSDTGLWTPPSGDASVGSSKAVANFPVFHPRAHRDESSSTLRPLAPPFDPHQSRQTSIPEFYPRQQLVGWGGGAEFQPTAQRAGQRTGDAMEDFRSAYNNNRGGHHLADTKSTHGAFSDSRTSTGGPQDRRYFGSTTSSAGARPPYATPPQGQTFSGQNSPAQSEAGYTYHATAVADIPRHNHNLASGSNGISRAAKGLYDPATGGIIPPAPVNEYTDQFVTAPYPRKEPSSVMAFPLDLPPLRFGSGILSNSNYQPGQVAYYPVDPKGGVSGFKEPLQSPDFSSRPNVRKDTSFSSASSSTSSRSSRPSSQRSPSQSISGAGTPGVSSSATLSHPLPARPDWTLRHDHETSHSNSASLAGVLSGFKSGNTSRAASVASVATSASLPSSELGSGGAGAGGSVASASASSMQHSPAVSVVNVASIECVGVPSHSLPRMSSPGSASSSAREASPSVSSSASASGGMSSSHDGRGTFTGTASPISTSASGNVSVVGAGSDEKGEVEQDNLNRDLGSINFNEAGRAEDAAEASGV